MESFEDFFDRLSESNRRILLLALEENPYAFFVRCLEGGGGNKTYATLVDAVLRKVISQSESMSKQYMAQLYLLYASSTAGVAMSPALNNVDISSTLDAQSMAWKYIHKTGVWDRVRSALKDNGMSGIEVQPSAHEIADLYTKIRRKDGLNSWPITENYVTVSYVQTKRSEESANDCAPSNWSQTVAESMIMVRDIYDKMYGTTHVGLWWDKLASRQYSGAQRTWPATANLQFPTHLTIVCFPLARKEDYDVPLWSSVPAVDRLVDEMVLHTESCPLCAGLPWVNEHGSPRISPSMASRCWPLIEIRLANMNIGAFINAEQAKILLDTMQTLLFVWNTCNKVFACDCTTYNMHTSNIRYLDGFEEHMRRHNCADANAIAHHVVGSTLSSHDMDKVQKEFISMIGILMSVASNVTLLELYLDSKKVAMHPRVVNFCQNKSELEDTEGNNISTLKKKHELTRWEPESVANTINELLNGYAYNSPCYDPKDKMVAAICLMDLELTQEVLRSWNHELNEQAHPFAALCNEENWSTICRSDNMSRLSVEYGRAHARRVEGFWTGCLQSKLSSSILVDAVLNVLNVGQHILHRMQNIMQQEFNSRINVTGRYFEGIDACMYFVANRDTCIECSNKFNEHSSVEGRYTVIATKQLRGVTQIKTDGDTQIVLTKNGKVHTVANMLIGFDDSNAITCMRCDGKSSIINYGNMPTGVACVHVV